MPFVSKAIGAPLAKLACRLMLGERLADLDLPGEHPGHVSVKEAVLPFARFAGADAMLGPEMRSTGEVMGIAATSRPRSPRRRPRPESSSGRGDDLHQRHRTDKPVATQIAARFHDLGFEVIATSGTAQAVSRMGVPVREIKKIGEARRNVVDCIRDGEVDLRDQHPAGPRPAPTATRSAARRSATASPASRR